MNRFLLTLACALFAGLLATAALPRAAAQDAEGNALRDVVPPPISDEYELLSSAPDSDHGDPSLIAAALRRRQRRPPLRLPQERKATTMPNRKKNWSCRSRKSKPTSTPD